MQKIAYNSAYTVRQLSIAAVLLLEDGGRISAGRFDDHRRIVGHPVLCDEL